MDFGEHIAEVCIMAALVAIGVLWNASNLVVIVQHLWKTSGYQTVGLIISSISVSNVFLELSMLGIVVSVWAGMFCLTELHPFHKAAIIVWTQSNCMSFWSIAWLSVYYCVKVTSVSGALLGKLKRNISPLINAALLLTTLCSFAVFVPFFGLHFPPRNGIVANETRNATCTIDKVTFPAWVNVGIYGYFLVLILCIVPLLVMLPTSLRLVAHLCRHTLAMNKSKNQFQGTDSYLLVCKLTVSLVGVYLITLAIVCLFFIDQAATKRFGFDIIALGCSFYSIVTGILLTVSNKYLKEKLWAVFCWRKSPGPVITSQSEQSPLS
ncbi:hypothetical protein AAFF_G00129620 [Aldrovandia affinis]|uniref:Taste receptor type 2 n=1 Tax=Aldrovandia affinis TaxID=143900 RepID=A0AAD7RQY1_9TELE|nr:hypothetical protein AAFF_G00129620 [Aldrovandia affinis]